MNSNEHPAGGGRLLDSPTRLLIAVLLLIIAIVGKRLQKVNAIENHDCKTTSRVTLVHDYE